MLLYPQGNCFCPQPVFPKHKQNSTPGLMTEDSRIPSPSYSASSFSSRLECLGVYVYMCVFIYSYMNAHG